MSGGVGAFNGATCEGRLLHDIGASSLRGVGRNRNIFHLFKLLMASQR